jgi:hypothetical protein
MMNFGMIFKKKAKAIATKIGINMSENKNRRKINSNKNLLEFYMETTTGQGSNRKSSEFSKD